MRPVASVPAEAGATAAGYEALAAGEWARARDLFQEALGAGDSPDALDGLGRALWWLRDARSAVVARERAYSGFRRDGDLARAARIALWLAREHALLWGNDAVANGWLGRAERLLADVSPRGAAGWLELARAERARDPDRGARHARAALDVATRTGDADLELRPLAELGLAEVKLGAVEEGLSRIDEAMAAAIAGEAPAMETFADVGCTLMAACEIAGDTRRRAQWSRALEEFARSHDHVALLGFCRTCCADVHAGAGRVDAAEEELLVALRELSEAGQRARCVHPASRLARIRILQGRHAEAERFLAGFEDAPEAAEAAVELRLARGEHESAELLVEARLAEIGRANLLAAPLLARLVEARLGRGDIQGAREAAAELDALCADADRQGVRAAAALAAGRIAAAAEGERSLEHLQRAVNIFADLGNRLDAARARLELARELARTRPGAAVDVARRARDELDALGAVRDAGDATALLRSLGERGRAGPRAAGDLTRREREILGLLAEGLSNARIGARLFISPRTVEHHLSRAYGKLGLRTRAEAAAWAVRNLVID